jgi:lipid-A-disaccharide synthase
VITKSGTSTLEAMILGKPMIIVYRGSPAMAVEWRMRKRRLNIQYVGMPNILAEEMLFPELLQDDATPEAIARLALDMLLQPERILALKERLADVSRATLGEPGAIRRAAELLYETATK